MKTSTQLKALIRNLSQAKKVEAEIILRNFMLERFLERISISKYKRSFILKGGMLIADIVGIDTRTTMDMDITIRGEMISEAQIMEIINHIIDIRIDDGVVFSLSGIEEIREEADYPGYRVSVDAAFDKTRQTMHLDITAGDSITPREIEYSFKLMFENRSINIMAYNLETVLAEKFETIITRGLTNTRMRDFYDIYILTLTQSFDKTIFHKSLEATVLRRKTTEQMAYTNNVIEKLITSETMIDVWTRYQKNYQYAYDISWRSIIDALNNLTTL